LFEIARNKVLSEHEYLMNYPERVEARANNALDLMWLEIRQVRPSSVRISHALKRIQRLIDDKVCESIFWRFRFYSHIATLFVPEVSTDIEEAHVALESLIDHSEYPITNEEKLTTLVLLGEFAHYRETQTTKRNYVEEVLVSAKKSNQDEIVVHCKIVQGMQSQCADPKERLRCLEEAARLCTHKIDNEVRGEALECLGDEYVGQTRWIDGIKTFVESKFAYSNNGQSLQAAVVQMKLAETFSKAGEHSKAQIEATTGLKILERLGSEEDISIGRSTALRVFSECRELEAYLELTERLYAETFFRSPDSFNNPNACYLRYRYLDSAMELCNKLADAKRAEFYRLRSEDQKSKTGMT
jgi:hypothetical protein